MPWFSSCDYCTAQGSAFHGAPMFMLRARWLELAFRSCKPSPARTVRSTLYGASAQPQHRIPYRCNAASPAVATLHPPLPQHHTPCRYSAASIPLSYPRSTVFPAAAALRSSLPQRRIPRCCNIASSTAASRMFHVKHSFAISRVRCPLRIRNLPRVRMLLRMRNNAYRNGPRLSRTQKHPLRVVRRLLLFGLHVRK